MMPAKYLILILSCVTVFFGCGVSKTHYQPYRKIPKQALQADFLTFRHILEEGHPGLYWYTPKDSIDYYFDVTYAMITDSMTEQKFRPLLSYLLSKIQCGHTSARYSKKYSSYLDTARQQQFPLSIKLWDDTAVVYANLNWRDSVLKKGTIVTGIDDRPISFYRDSLFQFLSMDGHGIINKYQTLSNLGSFSGWYRNIFGLTPRFKINYLDSSEKERTVFIPVFDPQKDTTRDTLLINYKKTDRKERRQNSRAAVRNLELDKGTSTAYLTLNTFIRGRGLTTFIRKSLRRVRSHQMNNLVIDVRNNGGGNVGISNLLTRYLVDHRYKLADSLYAVNKKSSYGRYIANNFWNRLSMTFITRKRSDGKYHFGYFERHYFSPRKRYHFNGDVYVLTGGNSFSATSLFARALKGQRNVTLVGEETGGGSYGNNAWLIPDVTLPKTGLRFTLPKFRMVVDKNAVKNGRGVLPDAFARPTVESIRNNVDLKMNVAKQLIAQKRLSKPVR